VKVPMAAPSWPFLGGEVKAPGKARREWHAPSTCPPCKSRNIAGPAGCRHILQG